MLMADAETRRETFMATILSYVLAVLMALVVLSIIAPESVMRLFLWLGIATTR